MASYTIYIFIRQKAGYYGSDDLFRRRRWELLVRPAWIFV